MIGPRPACLDIALRLYVVILLWIDSTLAPWAQDLGHDHQIKTSMYNYRSLRPTAGNVCLHHVMSTGAEEGFPWSPLL